MLTGNNLEVSFTLLIQVQHEVAVVFYFIELDRGPMVFYTTAHSVVKSKGSETNYNFNVKTLMFIVVFGEIIIYAWKCKHCTLRTLRHGQKCSVL